MILNQAAMEVKSAIVVCTLQEALLLRLPRLGKDVRQLILQFCSHYSWPSLKADAKVAFLQGKDIQLSKQIFGMPLSELARAMGLERSQSIQFLKAAYGLTVAPEEFSYWSMKR